jgi:hypothetical protein
MKTAVSLASTLCSPRENNRCFYFLLVFLTYTYAMAASKVPRVQYTYHSRARQSGKKLLATRPPALRPSHSSCLPSTGKNATRLHYLCMRLTQPEKPLILSAQYIHAYHAMDQCKIKQCSAIKVRDLTSNQV